MTYSNFTNGALVLRVWKFDGDCELLAKFQYWDHNIPSLCGEVFRD